MNKIDSEYSFHEENTNLEFESLPIIYPDKDNMDPNKKTPTIFETVSPSKKYDDNKSNPTTGVLCDNLLDSSIKDDMKKNPPQNPSEFRFNPSSSQFQPLQLPQPNVLGVEDLFNTDFPMGRPIETQSNNRHLNESENRSWEPKDLPVKNNFTFAGSIGASKTKFEKDENINIPAPHQEPKEQIKDSSEKKRVNKWDLLKENSSKDAHILSGNKKVQAQYFVEFDNTISQATSVVISQKEQFLKNNSRNEPDEKSQENKPGSQINHAQPEYYYTFASNRGDKFHEENLDQDEAIDDPKEESVVGKYPKLGSWKFDSTNQYHPKTPEKIITAQEIEEEQNGKEEIEANQNLEELEEKEDVNTDPNYNKKVDEEYEENKEEEEKESESIIEIKNNFIPPKDQRFETERRLDTLNFERTETLATDDGNSKLLKFL